MNVVANNYFVELVDTYLFYPQVLREYTKKIQHNNLF